jgi:F-type H+-transporting ATPase subunit epsilon
VAIKLKIITPAKTVFDGEVNEVYLPGINGEFGVLPDHAEMISTLGTGICRFTKITGDIERLVVSQGACHIANNEIHVVTHFAEFKQDVDPVSARTRILELDQKLVSADLSDEARAELEELRAREQARIDIYS